MPKNPRNPHSSPLKVETAGNWNPEEYRNYCAPKSDSTIYPIPVFGRNRVDGVTEYETIYDYQKSKSPESLEDKRLQQAINQDLKNRNIK